MVRRKLFSFVTALALVLSLFGAMPKGLFIAHALSGSGTQSDPYIITSYDELSKKLSNLTEDIYIKLGTDIIEHDILNGKRINVESNGSESYTVHLDLAGQTISRDAKTTDDCLFYIDNAAMIIDDSKSGGNISMSFRVIESNDQIIFYVTENGKLIINNGTISTNYNSVLLNRGTTIINGGTVQNNYNFYLITSYGTLEINGGELFSKHYDMIRLSKSSNTVITGGKITYSGSNIPLSYIISKGKLTAYAGTFASPKVRQSPFSSKEISDHSTIFKDGVQITKDYYIEYNPTCYELILSCNMPVHATLKVTEPVNGQKPQSATVTSSLGIIRDDAITSWYDLTDNKAVKYSDTFVGGHRYRLSAVIGAEDGYVIGRLPTVNINGDYSKDLSVERIAGTEYFCTVTTEFECPAATVTNIPIYVDEPQQGEKPGSASWYQNQGYSVYKIIWYNGNGTLMDLDSPFEAGKQYILNAIFRPADGYTFSADLTATVNGKKMDRLQNVTEVEFRYVFTATQKLKPIINLYVDFDYPETGANPDYTPEYTKPAQSQTVILKNIVWRDEKGERLLKTDTFGSAQQYALYLTYIPRDGYVFTGSFAVFINGHESDTFVMNSDGSVTVSWFYPTEDLIGDIDGNGIVNTADLTVFARSLAKWPGYPEQVIEINADIDQDGDADVNDYTILARTLARWPGYADEYGIVV